MVDSKHLPPCRQPEYVREYRRKRYQAKREQLLTYQRNWQRNNRSKMKSYDDKWREANPEAAKESDRKKKHKHYHSHPEYRVKTVDRMRIWVENNRDQHRANVREASHRRCARKYATSIGPINYKQLRADSNGLCGICKEPLNDSKIEYDHIIPLARGGTHTQDNLQLSHPRCNRVKNARLPEELEMSV